MFSAKDDTFISSVSTAGIITVEGNGLEIVACVLILFLAGSSTCSSDEEVSSGNFCVDGDSGVFLVTICV